MRAILQGVIIVIIIGLVSCKKDKSAEETFFMRAEQVNVVPTSKQGSASHKITDLWLYVNGQFQGAYPTDALLPIVSKGKPVTINIFAGIKNNGISNTRINWNFYELFTLDTFVTSNANIVRNIDFEYNPFTTFDWLESFDGSTGFAIKKSSISSVNYRMAEPADCFEGRSIYLALSGDSVTAQIESTNSYSLPSGSSNVYLELNYKGNEDFTVGLIGDNDEFKPALNIAASESWNKIYVQLSTAVSSSPVSSKYRVAFRLLKRDDLDPKIFLDNIKLIHL